MSEEKEEKFHERRSHWFYGMSPMNIVSIVTLVFCVGVSWAVAVGKIDANEKRIGDTKSSFDKKINEVKAQIKESEERTREDIRDLRNVIIKEIRK